ncbi:MAG TPA: hypothetical protein VHA78_03230 [Candidatus Peribacteraceae bacterium]|nr:hypothetical protein [Candidatus Peribacteraceae bacterium]
MCAGLAVERRAIPDELVEKYHLHDRLVTRGDGPPEIQFHFRAKVPLLPVQHANQFDIFLWGNRDDKKSKLPRTGWCKIESLEAGKWKYLHPVEVEIPCSYGLEKGVWFQVQEGFKGIMVNDEKGIPHVYMLTQPASHYYEVMTRHDREPVFIGKSI